MSYFAHWLKHIESLGFSAGQANTSLAQKIQEQAFMLATNNIASGSIWIFAALIIVVWFARPSSKAAVAQE
jgi:MFS transporter, DHA2 family, multidrug resistance protein